MRFIKTKAIFLLIGIIGLLAAYSIVVSVKLSITMIKKENQLVEARTLEEKNVPAVAKASSSMNLSKTKKYPVYFNGSSQNAMYFYYSSKGIMLVPFDTILKLTGTKYKLFNADNVFQAVINQKKFTLKLGTAEASLGGETIKLETPSFAGDNHILAEGGILDFIQGCTIHDKYGESGVFLNYWPEKESKNYSKALALKLSSGSLKAEGLFSSSSLTYKTTSLDDTQTHIYQAGLSTYLIQSGNKTWLINTDHYTNLKLLDVPAEYEISPEGEFLYWRDSIDNAIYVYDINSFTQKKLKDYFTYEVDGKKLVPEGSRLTGYKIGKNYVAVDFGNSGSNDIYAIIERRHKIVAEGLARYSPDKRRAIFYDEEKGFYVIDGDGTDIILLKGALGASWVDNNRIIYKTNNGYRIFYRDTRLSETTGTFEKTVGQTPKGSVLYQKGKGIFSSDNTSGKLFNLPWECDYIKAISSKGPFCSVSLNGDSILGIYGDKNISLGTPSLFINKPEVYSAEKAFECNTTISSDNSKIALLQKGKSFIEVDITNFEDFRQEKLYLDYSTGDVDVDTEIKIKWLDNSSLVVFNNNQGWLMDMRKEPYIYKWVCNDKERFIGVFQKVR